MIELQQTRGESIASFRNQPQIHFRISHKFKFDISHRFTQIHTDETQIGEGRALAERLTLSVLICG